MADIRNPEVPDRPPTHEEIEKNSVVDGCMAAWYPQMGGYVARCWVSFGCSDAGPGGLPTSIPGFDVDVWHDGDFPFDDREPAHLHHCSAGQFIKFGQLCEKFFGDLVMKPGPELEMKERVANAIAASSAHGTVHLKNPAVELMLQILRGEYS